MEEKAGGDKLRVYLGEVRDGGGDWRRGLEERGGGEG